MKTYTGTIPCRYCNKTVNWKYTDTGKFRKTRGLGMSEWVEVIREDGVAICDAEEFAGIISFSTYCPYCGTPLHIDCTERIATELRSKSY